MSLYNMVCGSNPVAGRLLAAINLDPNTVPRFRDVWINDDMTEITVHTRTGGGNREDYEEENGEMVSHPLYLRDCDDNFDSTYADFTFRVTEEEKAKLLAEIADATEQSPPDHKRQIMEAITKEPRKKYDEAMTFLAEPTKEE
jgi:hypothetical protein